MALKDPWAKRYVLTMSLLTDKKQLTLTLMFL